MTSLAFIAGVMPLAIATGAGAASQNDIGTGVIGGMLTGDRARDLLRAAVLCAGALDLPIETHSRRIKSACRFGNKVERGPGMAAFTAMGRIHRGVQVLSPKFRR